MIQGELAHWIIFHHLRIFNLSSFRFPIVRGWRAVRHIPRRSPKWHSSLRQARFPQPGRFCFSTYFLFQASAIFSTPLTLYLRLNRAFRPLRDVLIVREAGRGACFIRLFKRSSDQRRHFRAGNGVIRLERSIRIAADKLHAFYYFSSGRHTKQQRATKDFFTSTF
ncbi:Uncharacterised protein [Paenibacillus macerans]|uniref:Uncharacterized protein n=1 Tax=Paenibacillus macerans TaxID=44252 RepID=A0A090ZLP0_PAEMA|nr:hypothetical protein DJ90_1922 [Paenibacillus macerans]SUA84307.1 Uncharacterised protein [Paenibacillus macerans]